MYGRSILVPVSLLLLTVLAAPASAAGGAAHFVVNGRFYEALKEVLRPGDVLGIPAAREPQPAGRKQALALLAGRKPGELSAEERRQLTEIQRRYPWRFNEKKFQQSIDTLVAIPDKRPEKAIVLSSYADLEKVIDRIPSDITLIGYNTEGGMTPAAERRDAASYIAKFAGLAHSKGFRASWGPTINQFAVMEKRGTRGRALKKLDRVGLQLQRVLQHTGLDRMKQFAAEKVALIRRHNPDIEISAQLVIGRQTVEECIEGFRALDGLVDYYIVFSLQEPAETRRIIEGYRRLAR